VAANIRAEIGRAGLTKLEVARRLGLSSGGFSLKLSGARPITLGEIEAIADMFGLDPAELLVRRTPRRGPEMANAPVAYATGASARPKGLEPPTFWSGVQRDEHLAEIVPLPVVSEPAIERDELATVHTLSPATTLSTDVDLELPHAR
jgi:transcriptional regulator with XRE-family HTH domain